MSHPHNPHNNIHPPWPEERLDQLRLHGLGCANRAEALQALRHLDGQLFAEYCDLLARPGASGYKYLAGVSFESALQLYRFDAALRVLLFDAIQTIEMSLRAQWANAPAAAHGPLFYADSALFRGDFRGRDGQGWSHSEALAKLRHSYRRRQELLSGLPLEKLFSPPAQEVVGSMSLGHLLHWFMYLRGREEREGIACAYGMDEAVLQGFLPSMVAARNICAHHDRLYGRSFRFHPPRSSKEPAALWESRAGGNDGTLCPVATFMAFLLMQIDGAAHRRFVCGLQELFAECETADPHLLGFPGDWRQRPVWRL